MTFTGSDGAPVQFRLLRPNCNVGKLRVGEKEEGRRMMWFERAGGAGFYSRDEGAERHGQVDGEVGAAGGERHGRGSGSVQ